MICKIGRVEIWRLLEINAPFLTPEELFPDDVEEAAQVFADHGENLLDPASRRLILPVQSFLMRTPDHVILIDTGVGNDKTNPGTPEWHMRSDDRFMAALTTAGVAPEDVDYVIFTHLHPDHVGWNTHLHDGRWVPTFPNARYLMPKADEAMLSGSGHPLYAESVLPVIEAGLVDLVEAGCKVGEFAELLPTPGHSPGHVSVLVADGGEELLITGDAIHCEIQCLRPDWQFVFDKDPATAVASRRWLLSNAAETGRRVLGFHIALPSIGRIKAEGDAYRWIKD